MPEELGQIDDVRSLCSFSARNNFPCLLHRRLVSKLDCQPIWNQRRDFVSSGIDAGRNMSAKQRRAQGLTKRAFHLPDSANAEAKERRTEIWLRCASRCSLTVCRSQKASGGYSTPPLRSRIPDRVACIQPNVCIEQYTFWRWSALLLNKDSKSV
jgi:hypothetical protein